MPIEINDKKLLLQDDVDDIEKMLHPFFEQRGIFVKINVSNGYYGASVEIVLVNDNEKPEEGELVETGENYLRLFIRGQIVDFSYTNAEEFLARLKSRAFVCEYKKGNQVQHRKLFEKTFPPKVKLQPFLDIIIPLFKNGIDFSKSIEKLLEV